MGSITDEVGSITRGDEVGSIMRGDEVGSIMRGDEVGSTTRGNEVGSITRGEVGSITRGDEVGSSIKRNEVGSITGAEGDGASSITEGDGLTDEVDAVSTTTHGVTGGVPGAHVEDWRRRDDGGSETIAEMSTGDDCAYTGKAPLNSSTAAIKMHDVPLELSMIAVKDWNSIRSCKRTANLFSNKRVNGGQKYY